jgi:hypothetical protein
MTKETTKPAVQAQKKPTGIINIHGRDYETVALRVQKFREAHKDWSLITEIVHRDASCVLMKATIKNQGGVVVATGHSEEYRTSSGINKTSALENAETSAIGRCLASLGLGGTEFASANEVQVAIASQDEERASAFESAADRELFLGNAIAAFEKAATRLELKELGVLYQDKLAAARNSKNADDAKLVERLEGEYKAKMATLPKEEKPAVKTVEQAMKEGKGDDGMQY